MTTPPMRETRPGLVLMTTDTVGGVWHYSLELARGLALHGVRVALATMGQPISAAQRLEAGRVPGLSLHPSAWKLEWMPDAWGDVDGAGPWLLELENTLRPDVIHLNGYVHGALSWSAPSLVVGHACVLSWWEAVRRESAPAEWSLYRQRVREGLRETQLVVAPTQAMLGSLETWYGTLRHGRVIPNSREAAHFPPAPTRQPFIFAAGRLGDEGKNIATLGEAAAGLRWPVFVAGARADSSGRTPLPSNVTSCGNLAPEGVAQWMAAAGIYCLPARYEPFGLSILEAGLAGRALVLGDIPSLRETWEGVALFAPPDDAMALRCALQHLILDPDLRRAYAAAARERALLFTPERTTRAYLEAYRELLLTPDRIAEEEAA